MKEIGQWPVDEEAAVTMASGPGNRVSALIETPGAADGPVTNFSFPWLDAKGKIRMIQAYLCH